MEIGMHIDLNYIMKEIGIDEDSLLELLSIYCSEMSQEMLQATEHLANQDWIRLQRTIHNVKGVSANLYIQSMYEMAASIDSRLKAKDTEGISTEIDKLIKVYSVTETEIKNLLDQNYNTF